MKKLNLSPEAQAWLESQPPDTIECLIELAAEDSWLAARIAAAIGLPMPNRIVKPRGAPVKVSDDRLLELQSQGFTPAKIAEIVGLSRTQVGTRLKRLKEKE